SIILVSGNELLSSEAHFVAKNTQQWESKQSNVLIQFAYEPERPIIDTFTELKFNIQNLSTGQHLENLTGRVVVTNGQRLFKFENISIPAGHFSVKYIFPDDGTHQVLLRLDRGNDFKIPASFDVFVPHQSPPSILDPFPSSSGTGTSNDDLGMWISKILAILLPASAIAALIIILKKKPKKHS
ncbi:MAG: hypothetical protein WCE92_08625, partial [Nitrososphaeraceae archaeon]